LPTATTHGIHVLFGAGQFGVCRQQPLAKTFRDTFDMKSDKLASKWAKRQGQTLVCPDHRGAVRPDQKTVIAQDKT
jgi:hypothetical protein